MIKKPSITETEKYYVLFTFFQSVKFHHMQTSKTVHECGTLSTMKDDQQSNQLIIDKRFQISIKQIASTQQVKDSNHLLTQLSGIFKSDQSKLVSDSSLNLITLPNNSISSAQQISLPKIKKKTRFSKPVIIIDGSKIFDESAQQFESTIQRLFSPSNTKIEEEPSKFVLAEQKLSEWVQRYQNSQVKESKISDYFMLEEDRVQKVEMIKNSFVYCKVFVQGKLSPMTLNIRNFNPKVKTYLRIFASNTVEKPNRLNCDVEIQGKVLKYFAAKEERNFNEKIVFITIFSKENSFLGLHVSFQPPNQKNFRSSYHAYTQSRQEKQNLQPSPLYGQIQMVQDILAKRSLANLVKPNMIRHNKNLEEFEPRIKYIKLREQVENRRIRIQETKYKGQMNFIDKQISLVASQKLNEVAQELKAELMEKNIKKLRKYQFESTWLSVLFITHTFIPIISQIITVVKTEQQKQMRRDFMVGLFTSRIQRRLNKFGIDLKGRTSTMIKLVSQSAARHLKKKSKKRILFMFAEFFKQTSRNYVVLTNSINLLKLLRRCVFKLKNFRISKLQFITTIKNQISKSLKGLLQEAQVLYEQEQNSKEEKKMKSSQIQGQNKQKKYISSQINEYSLVNELTRQVFHQVFVKWTQNLETFREVMRCEKKKMAKFIQPPKLFQPPSHRMIQEIFLLELKKMGLIKYVTQLY